MPAEMRSARLLLRAWCASDASALAPILVANFAYLSSWIPARIASPGPVDALRARLSGFAADFAYDREWRYAIVTLDTNTLLGELSLFPRDANTRVPASEADRIELGYWLRADENGRGFVTEAARLACDVVAEFERFTRLEIRCDARNARSAAVAERLGFVLDRSIHASATAADPYLQVWIRSLATSRAATGTQGANVDPSTDG